MLLFYILWLLVAIRNCNFIMKRNCNSSCLHRTGKISVVGTGILADAVGVVDMHVHVYVHDIVVCKNQLSWGRVLSTLLHDGQQQPPLTTLVVPHTDSE